MGTSDPEKRIVRGALPYAFPALVLAFALGTVLVDANAGWSAAIGVAVVTANLIAQGLSLAWAARMSPMILSAVALLGFVVRLALVFAALFALNTLDWFSPIAFGAAVVPATIALLIYEMRVLSGQVQVDLWSLGDSPR